MTGHPPAADTKRFLAAAEERYKTATPRSRRAYERTSSIVPSGSPAGIAFVRPHPLYIRRGEGCYVYDVDGRQIVDLLYGDWILPVGHNHPKIRAAIAEQLQHGTTFGTPVADLVYRHASMLQQRMPSLEQLRYSNSGTEATLAAVRLARAFTKKPKIAKWDGAYHGTHDSVTIANGRSNVGLLPGVAENVVLLPFNNAKACEEIIEREKDKLAAVIVEPMMCTNGMIPPLPGFHKRIREVTKRCGVLLIFDEVVTFTLARGGAQELFGIAPDLTTLGKAIGGGLPLGAYGGRADIMGLMDPAQPGGAVVAHGGTTGGHPLSLAAGIAHLKLLTPAAFRKLHALGDRAREGIAAVARKYEVPLQVTGMGHFFALHWTPNKVVDYAGAASSDHEVIRGIVLGLRARGFMPFARGTGYLCTAMTTKHIDRLVAALEDTLLESGLAGR
ncbi:MAG: aspartate aminotransferase family protein [Chloroflexi bacterium]|nr:aspartate aminotransferase family protein [Chloroflexota bacterium]